MTFRKVIKEIKINGLKVSDYIIQNNIDFELKRCYSCNEYIEPYVSKTTPMFKYKMYENFYPIHCESCFKKMYIKRDSYNSIEFRYGKEAVNHFKSKTNGSKENFVRRYGEENGTEKFNTFREKSKHTKEKYIHQLGIEEGNKRWELYIQTKKETTGRAIEYWLKIANGNIVLAKELQSQSQNFSSLEFFTKKYGEENGTEKFIETNSKKANTLERYIEKYGEEIGKDKFAESYGFDSYKEMKSNKEGKRTSLFYDRKYRCYIFQDQSFCCPICKRKPQDGLRFDLHHIDYDIKNDTRNNLIWLCCSCHMKTNYNRNEFKHKLNEINENIVEKSRYTERYKELKDEYHSYQS